jgi:hypothetical protein
MGVVVKLLGAAGTAMAVNVAVTDFTPSIVTLQVAAAPVHPPAHPVNVDPTAAAAVNITVDLPSNLTLQVPGQLIPTGLDVTVPAPFTVTVMVAGVTAQATLEYGESPPALKALTR